MDARTRRIQSALELQIKVLDQVVAAKPVPELRMALIKAKQGLVQVREQEQELAAQFNSLLDLPAGTVLELSGYGMRIELFEAIDGPLTLGYAAHFGLGISHAVDD